MGFVTVNGVDLTTFGYVVRSVEGLTGGVARTYATDDAPHAVGQTLLDDTPRIGARTVTIRGTLRATTPAALVVAYRRLLAHLSTEPIDVTWSLESDRFARGRLVSDSVPVLPRQGLQKSMHVDFVVECHSPYLAASAETEVALSTSAAACALGTWDSAPTIAITGASDVTLTYADHDGATQGSMAFEGVTGTLTVDMATWTATDDDGNAMSKLASGDFFLLEAAHADLDAEDWPTLVLSAGTGTATYRKRWR